MKIVVIIPTYNEKETIGAVIDALELEFKLMPKHHFAILVVDGNSPDGTASIVKSKSRVYSNIKLLVESKKSGLGLAYFLGMKFAIGNLGAEAVVEMDGDFQHNPVDLKRLVRELDNGYDYVIGSRYITGGQIPKTWAWYRKLLSWVGSLFIRIVLRLPIRDNTSGFKISRVKPFMEKLPLEEDQILSRRHAYKIHLLYEMIKMGAKTKEIPIVFGDRRRGNSKSSLEDILESLGVVWKLYWK